MKFISDCLVLRNVDIIMKSCMVLVLLALGLVSARAAPLPGAMLACLSQECDLDSGPVCAIDATGLPQTFDNRCTAILAFCRFGSFYAEVKPGEC